MTSSLEERLVREIRTEGPLPFDRYMEAALYDPEGGYYMSGGPRTGWRGHFITSPEMDPTFGWLWARALLEIWRSAGEPDRFDVVEIGPGEGGLARAILASCTGSFADSIRYTLVEHAPQNRARQKAILEGHDNVSWVEDLDELGPIETGCVLCHEVLDNLPVKVLIRDHTWRELHVDDDDGRLVPVLRDPDPALLASLQGRTVEGCLQVEVPVGGVGMIERIAGMIVKGAAIFVDYGYREPSEHPQGTLVCYSETGADTAFFDRPGSKDITSHVDWGWLTRMASALEMGVGGPSSQRDVLRRLGIADADEALKREHEQALRDKRGGDAVRALSRRQALGALTDPGGLGGLQIMVVTRQIPVPGWIEPAR